MGVVVSVGLEGLDGLLVLIYAILESRTVMWCKVKGNRKSKEMLDEGS